MNNTKLKLSILIVLLAQFVFAQSKIETMNECLTCHQEGDMLPEDFVAGDIHLSMGLTCADCHGGDPSSADDEIAMSEAKGFVGVPEISDIPGFCGKCHSDIDVMRKYNPRMETDQVSQYFTSVHGIQLKEGNEDIAVCTSCHTAHAIFPAKDPRATVNALNVPGTCEKCHGDQELMSKYNLSANVFDEYSKSVHGKALLEDKDTGAPACNDCHGNHGAIPPGVTSISYVCGECHVNNMNLFKSSAMGRAFVEMDFHGCVECHDNHLIEKPDDSFVGTSETAACSNCHEPGEKGYEVAKGMHTELTQLATVYDSAKVRLDDVKVKGMNDEDIEFMLKDVKQNLIRARTFVHSFDLEQLKEKSVPGKSMADSAIVLANMEIGEYHFRRNGLAIATLIFTLFAVGLFFKIRGMEKNKS